MSDTAPTGLMPRQPDRRKTQQRAVDLRLHLTRELVIETARNLVDAHAAHSPESAAVLSSLVDLVAVLRDAEQAVFDAGVPT